MTFARTRAWFSSATALILAVAPLRAQRMPVEAARGMVVSVHELASQAGLEILKKGGNAVDAAVATGLTLDVVYPWAGAVGGGGFMLIHLADGRDIAIDYRETAPAAATRNMYLGPDGNVVAGASTVGWRASGVPGTVAGFALALEKYGSGKITWADACEPARRLAEGHVVTAFTAQRFRSKQALLARFEDSKRILLKGGALWQTGELWPQPELAATFARLQQKGPREFYEGETAQKIAAAMAAHGGTITLADLKAYRPVERTPLRGTYRGHEIVTMSPPSSGGVAVLQMLAMLEPFDLAKMGAHSSARHHLFVEAMRRAFRVRAEYMGDPDFNKLPLEELLAPGYTAALMKSFDPAKATPSRAVALPPLAGESRGGASAGEKAQRYFHLLLNESAETTHYSIVDAAGNAVANTCTLNAGFGSGVTIPGTGILMNNEMDDFTARAGVPNFYGLLQGEANTIAPAKRPLSAMTPTFVFKGGRLLLVTGSPGGPTIINTVLQVVTNVIDHGMPVTQAVEAPRLHHQWMPDQITYEPFGLATDVMDALRAKGHAFVQRDLYADDATSADARLYDYYIGDASTIMVDPKTHARLGAADPRKPDAKAVGH